MSPDTLQREAGARVDKNDPQARYKMIFNEYFAQRYNLPPNTRSLYFKSVAHQYSQYSETIIDLHTKRYIKNRYLEYDENTPVSQLDLEAE